MPSDKPLYSEKCGFLLLLGTILWYNKKDKKVYQKKAPQQLKYELVLLGNLVPQDHLILIIAMLDVVVISPLCKPGILQQQRDLKFMHQFPDHLRLLLWRSSSRTKALNFFR